jgi:hypothetical protein
MHRRTESEGTYGELVAQRSQALAMLPARQQPLLTRLGQHT